MTEEDDLQQVRGELHSYNLMAGEDYIHAGHDENVDCKRVSVSIEDHTGNCTTVFSTC